MFGLIQVFGTGQCNVDVFYKVCTAHLGIKASLFHNAHGLFVHVAEQQGNSVFTAEAVKALRAMRPAHFTFRLDSVAASRNSGQLSGGCRGRTGQSQLHVCPFHCLYAG